MRSYLAGKGRTKLPRSGFVQWFMNARHYLTNKTNIQGYDVVFLAGMHVLQRNYDVLRYDPLLQTGSLYDYKDTRFFLNVYLGN
jgi:hypothetical protein